MGLSSCGPVVSPQEKNDTISTTPNRATLARPQLDLRWCLKGLKFAVMCPATPARNSHESH